MTRTKFMVMRQMLPPFLLGGIGCAGICYRSFLPGSMGPLPGVLSVFAALLLLGWRLGRLEHRMEEWRCMEARLGFLRETLEKEERARISRELHDGLGQSLVAVKLNLQMLLATAARGEALRTEQVQQIIDDVSQLTLEMREVVQSFRPTFLESMSLEEAIRWFSDRARGASALAVRIEADQERPLLDGRVKYALFRIFQEAFVNATRHAQAQSVAVRIEAARHMVCLEVCDDGIGGVIWPSASRGGCGLAIMGERAALVGGRLQVISPPGGGTRLRVEVPLA